MNGRGVRRSSVVEPSSTSDTKRRPRCRRNPFNRPSPVCPKSWGSMVDRIKGGPLSSRHSGGKSEGGHGTAGRQTAEFELLGYRS